MTAAPPRSAKTRQSAEVVEASAGARTHRAVVASHTDQIASRPERSFMMAVPVLATPPRSQACELHGWVTISFLAQRAS